MKKITNVLPVLSMLLMSQAASAVTCNLTGVTLGMTGVDGVNGRVYAQVSTPTTTDCGCGNVRFYPENTDTKMILTTVLSAKLAGKTVRMDISDEADCNSGTKAYIE